MPKHIDLKVAREFFTALLDGSKTFEVRKDDRGYAVGDVLILKEFETADPNIAGGSYTGRKTERVVTYKLPGGRFGLDADVCVLGLGLVSDEHQILCPWAGAPFTVYKYGNMWHLTDENVQAFVDLRQQWHKEMVARQRMEEELSSARAAFDRQGKETLANSYAERHTTESAEIRRLQAENVALREQVRDLEGRVVLGVSQNVIQVHRDEAFDKGYRGACEMIGRKLAAAEFHSEHRYECETLKAIEKAIDAAAEKGRTEGYSKGVSATAKHIQSVLIEKGNGRSYDPISQEEEDTFKKIDAYAINSQSRARYRFSAAVCEAIRERRLHTTGDEAWDAVMHAVHFALKGTSGSIPDAEAALAEITSVLYPNGMPPTAETNMLTRVRRLHCVRIGALADEVAEYRRLRSRLISEVTFGLSSGLPEDIKSAAEAAVARA